mmetsp:Transcript_56841/g.158305  ORF Transcript_56841/g.158305 Transcript_56841/m.158305 type:complete len:418 (+) Transcript_56841:101-1354(+)
MDIMTPASDMGMVDCSMAEGVDDEAMNSDWNVGWGSQEGLLHEVNNIHAQHVTAVTSQATSAAWHADIAAKQAASLAQWVQYLWSQVAALQQKVTELEDWKKKTLDEMNKLRLAHKAVRRKVLPEGDVVDEDVPPVPKAKSLPLLLAEHMDTPSAAAPNSKKKAPKVKEFLSSMGTGDVQEVLPSPFGLPPGLMGLTFEDPDAGKQVRFGVAPNSLTGAAQSEEADEPQPTAAIVPRTVSALSTTSVIGSEAAGGFAIDESALEGVHIERANVDGVECERAEWKIGHLPSKLKNCMGRALVSSPFNACGLEELRLMIFPDGKEVAKGPRSKKQKEQYAKKVTDGPLDACLKLKVPDCPPPHTLEYYLKIGDIRKGPFSHNFQESTVHGCSDFGVDWLMQLDQDQSLIVSVEIVRRTH